MIKIIYFIELESGKVNILFVYDEILTDGIFQDKAIQYNLLS